MLRVEEAGPKSRPTCPESTFHRRPGPVASRSPRRHRSALRWLASLSLMLAAGGAVAHEPVIRCIQPDPDTVRCRGATNDGDEMPGARIEVLARDNRPLLAGKLASDSTFTFRRPGEAYYVLFDIGPGLQVTVEQEEITPTPEPGRRARWMQR